MRYILSFEARDFFAEIPAIDEYSSRKDWEEACWRLIGKHFGGDQPELLTLLTTRDERLKMIYRMAVIAKIVAGARTNEISRELWVTRQTISAIRKSMQENQFASSRSRGHKKRVYTELSEPREEYYPTRRTKYGRIRMY